MFQKYAQYCNKRKAFYVMRITFDYWNYENVFKFCIYVCD